MANDNGTRDPEDQWVVRFKPCKGRERTILTFGDPTELMTRLTRGLQMHEPGSLTLMPAICNR